MKTQRITDDRFLVFDEPRLLDWCASRIPHVATADGWHREGAQALGIADAAGNLLAVMVLHSFSPVHGDCQISMAATTPRWASKATIAALLDYPFVQLGCQRITTLIPGRNFRALRFNIGLGFVQEGIARRGFGGDDAVILGLLREDAGRWLTSRSEEDRPSVLAPLYNPSPDC
jgi:hypothetical protein